LRLCSDCVTESPDNTLSTARDGMLRLCGDCGLHNREIEVRKPSRWLSEMEDGSQPWGHGPITREFVTKAMMTRCSNAACLLSLAERGPMAAGFAARLGARCCWWPHWRCPYDTHLWATHPSRAFLSSRQAPFFRAGAQPLAGTSCPGPLVVLLGPQGGPWPGVAARWWPRLPAA
jgi:hypothetical protein